MTPEIHQLNSRISASALIAVYWVIALLSVGVFASAQILFSELEEQAIRGQALRAEQLADMGLAIAANPAVGPDDPLLSQKLNEMEGFQVSISREASRINLNAVLMHGHLDVLENLFALWELPGEEIGPLIEALIDWVDEDDEPTGSGAESSFYDNLGLAGLPHNRQFRSLDEVRFVRGADILEEVNPNWQDAFTLWGPGQLDLANASAEAVAAVCQCSLDSAESFVQYRRGPDEIENTGDDGVLDSIDQAWLFLDTPMELLEGTRQRVTLNSEPLRIQSTGFAGDLAIERIVILQGQETPEILDFETRRR